MTVIVCIKKGRSRERFLKDADNSGVALSAVDGLPRIFTVENYDIESFPMKGHSAILSIEENTSGREPPAANSFTIADDFTGGNWGLVRHVRRDAPWNVDRIKTPFPTYYRSVRDGTGVDVYAIEGPSRLTHAEFGGRVTRISGDGTNGASSPEHGTAALSLALGVNTGFARGSLGWLAEWGDYSLAAMITACGAVLSHYTERSATNRPAVCWVADQRDATSSAYEVAIADMIDAGIVVISVAGNFLDDLAITPRYPGIYTDVICVGGILAADIPFYRTFGGTGFGARVDVSAATERTHSADYQSDEGYRLFSGTSAAEPMVAGVVACMLQGKSRLTTRTQVQAVRAKLIANATTGRLRDQPQFGIPAGGLPDRILYLDPDIASEEIAGVT